MKKTIVSVLVAISSSAALAQSFDFSMPDFSLETRYEMDVISKNADVRAYAKKLGAKSFSVNTGKTGRALYTVATSNGCSFDVKVVYINWPGVDDVVVFNNAVCD